MTAKPLPDPDPQTALRERRKMRLALPLAVLAASLAIAALFIFRWQMVWRPDGLYRRDRWTNTVEFCHPRQDSDEFSVQCYPMAPPHPAAKASPRGP